jgi:hypothetical protein
MANEVAAAYIGLNLVMEEFLSILSQLLVTTLLVLAGIEGL